MRPYLATGYTMSADKKTYTFTLRTGVKFSNGKPMTSADVKFSIDQNRKATKGWAYLDTAITSVDAPSPDTVVIHLKFPWAPLLADLSIFANDDRARTTTAARPRTRSTSTRSAPARSSGTTGTRARRSSWSATPNYWQKGQPYLNSVTWTDVPSDNTRELQLKGGQAQIDQFPAWSTVVAAASPRRA